MSDDTTIKIVAAIVLNELGETLLVRKRGTAAFMQPGGKMGEGEGALDALSREVSEELNCSIVRPTARDVGTFFAPAANEPGYTVEAQLFVVSLVGEPSAGAEIEEIVWVRPMEAVSLTLAPLTHDFVLPIACNWPPSTL